MSTLELALNMLAEATTTELTKAQNPQGLEENRTVAKQGGTVAATPEKKLKHRPVARWLRQKTQAQCCWGRLLRDD